MQPTHLLFILFFLKTFSLTAQQKGYYRTPAVYENTVIFTAEGDLWKYDLTGNGPASRLTTHPGLELNPIISPDGKQVAFLGQYEGVTEVYVMNVNGGVPRRVSYDYNGRLTLSGWTKEGKILYRTTRFSQLYSPRMALLDPATSTAIPLPLAQAAQGCYDNEGLLYFTRFPNQGSKTKRYKGGFIEQVWKFDGRNEATNLTADYDGTSSFPMYHDNRIYFLSDRNGTMNIWSMNKAGKEVKQHTFSKGWDLQTPYLHGNKIVYQRGADIALLDITTGAEKTLDIHLLSDFDQRKKKWIKSPMASINSAGISPNGNYAAIISRGRVFVSPQKSDRWVEVTRRSGVRYKEAKFIDNKNLAVLSDETGEYEIWTMTADGSGTPRQITRNSKTMITNFEVSPDSRWIAYNDKNQVLRVVDMATGGVRFVYDSSYQGNMGFSWSTDSRFLSFTTVIENLNAQVNVLDVKTMKRRPVTTQRLDSYNPAWSSDSSWLYFLSDRNLRTKVSSPWGARQPEPYYTEMTHIYALPLDTVTKFPFLPSDSWLSDTVFTITAKGDTLQRRPKKKPNTLSGDKLYNWDYAVQSLYQVPVKSANIAGMVVAKEHLYWIDIGPTKDRKTAKLYALKMGESKKYELTEIATGVAGITLSANKNRLLIYFEHGNFAIADADGGKIKPDEAKLELANWAFAINPVEDWRQMYDDAWRMMRDYFYDRDLHKVDWVAVKKQYEPLLERVTDRYELDDLIAQAVGELSALHHFVYGGDKRTSPDRVPVGFLGAELKKTGKGFLIEHILSSDPDFPETASPLNKPELRIKEGHTITAVNNVPVTEVNNIGELLFNKVAVPVKLDLLDINGTRYERVVKPASADEERALRYTEWLLSRRHKVDSMSQNDFGYVHLQAMGDEDMDDFVKQYYPVFHRKGLIIDVRHNNGGNIDSWVLEKLMRKAWMYWQGRSGGPVWNMQYAFRGPMVILCDQLTASDGEAVAEGFRRLGLGKVIGMRTWGGEIWLSANNFLVDNGIATAAESGVFGPEGAWLIEGWGVEPDIVVDNLPYETAKGKDAQLEAAVKHLQNELKLHPFVPAKAPPFPDKSFDYNKRK